MKEIYAIKRIFCYIRLVSWYKNFCGIDKLYLTQYNVTKCKDYHDKGLEILDIPCNQFGGQAPGIYDKELY